VVTGSDEAARDGHPQVDQRVDQASQALHLDQVRRAILETIAEYCQRINDSGHWLVVIGPICDTPI
jgi:hypothetical protein